MEMDDNVFTKNNKTIEVLPKEEPPKEQVKEELPKEDPLKEELHDEDIEKYLAKFSEVHNGIVKYKNLVNNVKTAKHDQERIEKLTGVVMFSTELLEKMASIMVDMNNLFG